MGSISFIITSDAIFYFLIVSRSCAHCYCGTLLSYQNKHSATQFNHHKTSITNYNTSDTNSTVRRFKNARVAGGEDDDYWRFECK